MGKCCEAVTYLLVTGLLESAAFAAVYDRVRRKRRDCTEARHFQTGAEQWHISHSI